MEPFHSIRARDRSDSFCRTCRPLRVRRRIARRLSSLSDGSLDQIFPLRPVDQFDRAVVLETEPVGRIGDCYRSSFGSTSNLEKQLVLLRLQAGFLSRTFR